MHRCSVCNTPVPTDTSDRIDFGSRPRLQRYAALSVPVGHAFGRKYERHPSSDWRDVPNRYTIIRLLGAGGMAAVYQAWHESLSAAVALKLIRVDPTMPAVNVRHFEERFKRELKLARQVTHPNVVRIHDLGEVGGSCI